MQRHACKCMSDPMRPHGLYNPRNSLGQNTGVGRLSLLRGIFPTQGSNPGLLHCRRTLYQLSHKGSPGILEWVAFSFSSRSSRPRIKLGSPACRRIFYQLSYEGRSNRLPIKKKDQISYDSHLQPCLLEKN